MKCSTITFTNDSYSIAKEVKLSLKLLDIPYVMGLKPVLNPIKRPHFLTTKWSIIIGSEYVPIIKELITLISPTQNIIIAERERLVSQ